MRVRHPCCAAAAGMLMPAVALSQEVTVPSFTTHWVGFFTIAVFVLAYVLVMTEEFTHLRKSKPVMLAAGVIWAAIAFVFARHGLSAEVEEAVGAALHEYAQLLLFLLVAMTYVNAMADRQIFDALRTWLLRRKFTYRGLFWITGIIAFWLSPWIDNLTTALILGAVVITVGAGNSRFIALGCINVVVAANAGGAFSPFGDITTLMVWQRGHLEFFEFFALLVPSAVNFLVPALLMHFAVPAEISTSDAVPARLREGAIGVLVLFALTLATAVSFHNFLHLPPFLGMLTGLGYLSIFGHYLGRRERRLLDDETHQLGDVPPFDVFRSVARAEWDTLLFFFGVIFAVAGLNTLGYLALASEQMYVGWGATAANVAIGVLSAIVDNIPIMVAVLDMSPQMSDGQWLLVTLTAGVGGSMLSIGSAAGVALMGQARGHYTFFSHLRWTPAIALGYAASIVAHLWINGAHF